MRVKELEQKIEELGIDDLHYSLYGELKSDSIILYQNYNKWEIFYMDERGSRKQLGVFDEEEQACNFLYELLVKDCDERRKELASELDANSPWKGKTIKDLEQDLNKLKLRFKSELTYLEIFFFQESIVLRNENQKWNLYIKYLSYSNNKEMLIKTFIHEDTMCNFLYKYCLQKLNFEKAYF
ncbi:MAG: hypothetical protein LBQ74_05025 [Prevotella sp.]|jgi:hypothetical protein|nr:hypothetical protein [Prevotella sp.]